jgi:hypothetical protein
MAVALEGWRPRALRTAGEPCGNRPKSTAIHLSAWLMLPKRAVRDPGSLPFRTALWFSSPVPALVFKPLKSAPIKQISAPTEEDLALLEQPRDSVERGQAARPSSENEPVEVTRKRSTMLWFGITIFLGAFLLFQVQPLIGKFILPWFGSSPGVWATCMLFFQLMLLGGYTYAHLLVRFLKPRQQGWTHLCLLALAMITLPITPSEVWRPGPEDQPVLAILVILGASVGAPFLLLSSTGPLLQSWFALLEPDRSPYRLYALSNIGSVVALISYPFVFERLLTLPGQTSGWSWAYAEYALLCGACAWMLLKQTPSHEPSRENQKSAATLPVFDVFLWISLSACGSAMLLATTNQLVLDVSSIPFLWVLPLAVYLLTFILCFEGDRWYPRPLFCALLPMALMTGVVLLDGGAEVGLSHQVMGYSGSLFVCCMCCHGELARRKPAPDRLTSYFLLISLGGALGGLFVAIVAPAIFSGIYEYPLLLGASAVLILTAVVHSVLREQPSGVRRVARLASRLCWTVCVILLLWGSSQYLLTNGWFDAKERELSVADRAWSTQSRYVALASMLLVVTVLEWARRRRGIGLTTWWYSGRVFLTSGFALSVCLGLTSLVGVLGWQVLGGSGGAPYKMARNFYGVLTIEEYEPGTPDEEYALYHGRIIHGYQYTSCPDWPTSYYGPKSGIGIALQRHPQRSDPDRQFRVGVVGLGTGTVAAYMNASVHPHHWVYVRPDPRDPGDYLRYYEINPLVRDWAEQHFTFMEDARGRGADVEVFMGDARIVMDHQIQAGDSQGFDVLGVDAFSGDAIPIHLLTKESFAVYWEHLRADGILAINVTNRFVDLAPIVMRLGQEFGKTMVRVVREDDESRGVSQNDWVLLTSNTAFLDDRELKRAAADLPVAGPLWTDDFSSLYEVLKTN